MIDSLLILLIGHLLGDYYFQTKKMADSKHVEKSYLALHCLLYSLVMFALLSTCYPVLPMLATSFIILLTHVAIDSLKIKLVSKGVENSVCFLIDQILHLIVLIAAACFIAARYSMIPIIDITQDIPLPQILVVVFSVLFIGKPSNIIIKTFILKYKPKSVEDDGIKAGASIGIFERLIIVIFLGLNQFAAIGLVLTAKSIARYKEISDNKQFAEYYLLGTLFSLLLVLIPYVLFNIFVY